MFAKQLDNTTKVPKKFKQMDIPLTSIQVAILLELEQARAPVFADTIAKKFGVSSGVIRYNISNINNWLKSKYGQIISRPKFGYKLDIEEPARKLLLGELNRAKVQSVYSAAERKQLLTFEILCNSDYQSLENLAERISLSKSTLLRELSFVEEVLAKQQLFLQKRPHRGSRVVGPEISIRHALVLLILEVIPEITLMKLAQWGINENKSSEMFLHPVQNNIIQAMTSWDIPGAMRLVEKVEEDFTLRLGDSRFLYLVLYWAVAVFRYRNGQVVSMPGEYTESALSEHETGMIKKIMDSYSLETRFPVPEAEALVFLLEVFSSPYNKVDGSADEPRNLNYNDKQVSALAVRLVEQMGKVTGHPIKDPELLDRMTKHLENMLVRIKYNLPIENPFAQDVIHSYPEIWQATVEAVKTLSPDLGNLSHEETAFLAMYFVLAKQMDDSGKPKRAPRVIVVCPTGGVSVWMLVSRLKTEIPALEIAANVSLREMTRIDKNNVDAIITTARNITDRDLPVICVTPFLSEADISKIKTQFRIWGYPF